MGRRKTKTTEEIVVNNTEETKVVNIPENFMNPPEDKESLEEIKVENSNEPEISENHTDVINKKEKPINLKKVLRFTPVGPKVEYI